LGIKNLFKKEEISRLSKRELREFYLDSKKYEKRWSIYAMIISILITIAITSISFYLKIYWILVFAIIFLIGFILNLTRYGNIIEDIFENKIVDGEK